MPSSSERTNEGALATASPRGGPRRRPKPPDDQSRLPPAAPGIPMRLDPTSLEILGTKAAAAAEEMSYTLQRTGRTLYVKETADFATGLVRKDGLFFAYPRSVGVAFFVALD